MIILEIDIGIPHELQVWYDIETYQSYAGSQSTYINAPLEKIPVFQRGGSIVPRKMRVRRSSSLMVSDPFTLVICLDKQVWKPTLLICWNVIYICLYMYIYMYINYD